MSPVLRYRQYTILNVFCKQKRPNRPGADQIDYFRLFENNQTFHFYLLLSILSCLIFSSLLMARSVDHLAGTKNR